MSKPPLSIRLATPQDIPGIISLSHSVQTALTATGSLQNIGPLSHDNLSSAVGEQCCYVATYVDNSNEILGCAMIRPISSSCLPETHEFRIASFPQPRRYLHSFMFAPEVQGNGYGSVMFGAIVEMLAVGGAEGTVFLDCWAGNEKLRSFWEGCGCSFVGVVPEHSWEVAVFVWVLGGAVGGKCIKDGGAG